MNSLVFIPLRTSLRKISPVVGWAGVLFLGQKVCMYVGGKGVGIRHWTCRCRSRWAARSQSTVGPGHAGSHNTFFFEKRPTGPPRR